MSSKWNGVLKSKHKANVGVHYMAWMCQLNKW